jgi:hypothetical protein
MVEDLEQQRNRKRGIKRRKLKALSFVVSLQEWKQT